MIASLQNPRARASATCLPEPVDIPSLSNHLTTRERLAGFSRWLTSEAGRVLCENEQEGVRNLIPRRYFPVAVQFGAPACAHLDSVNCGRAYTLVPGMEFASDHGLVSDFESLPFGHHSVDLAVLPHALDFVQDPHMLLRELTQAMAPDGCLVVVGFQPYSLWGMRKLLHLRSTEAPWVGHFFSTSRVQDWLSLMGYRVLAGRMMLYRPPMQPQRMFDRLKFMESAGDRWWPMFGAVYVVVARLETMRVIPVGQPRRRRFRPALAPVARKISGESLN